MALEWEAIAADFEPDGSFRDVYVIDTTVEDWQRLVTFIRQWGWWHAYEEDGHATRLPSDVREIFGRRSRVSVLLRLRPFRLLNINCHFFGEDEIEFDLDPREVSGQEGLDELCAFVRTVGRALERRVIVTLENSQEVELMAYEPDRDEIVRTR